MKSNKDDSNRQLHKEKCELALEGSTSNKSLDQLLMLVDDEELELRELQAGPNPLTCSDHLGTSGVLGCSLCKGWFSSVHDIYLRILEQVFHLML